MKLSLYQIDAFTNRVFCGNPAAVCPLKEWLDDSLMQAIALENNLSETAFFVREEMGYRLRWFTPIAEVELCGHATLASAFVILNYLQPDLSEVSFETRSGRLIVYEDGDLLAMDFPSHPPKACTPPPQLLAGLKLDPEEVLQSANYFVVYNRQQDVLQLRPNMNELKELGNFGVIVTARGEGSDFVSRYFAPQFGIDEDPATGSTHCALTPYWSQKLSKRKLHALQLSARGGEFFCEDRGDRVTISGQAVKVIEGRLYI
ncbi:PhzF family phenazine biosynthesis protein [bacterium]|nr:PhzF family phenazine biosynthesis protein [bacterium]